MKSKNQNLHEANSSKHHVALPRIHVAKEESVRARIMQIPSRIRMIVSGIMTFFINDIVPFAYLVNYRIECNRVKGAFFEARHKKQKYGMNNVEKQ